MSTNTASIERVSGNPFALPQMDHQTTHVSKRDATDVTGLSHLGLRLVLPRDGLRELQVEQSCLRPSNTRIMLFEDSTASTARRALPMVYKQVPAKSVLTGAATLLYHTVEHGNRGSCS